MILSEDFKLALGHRIHKLRVDKHLTQQGLAQKLNCADAATISYFENGKRLPSIEMLYSMSKLFNVSITFLLEGEDTSIIIPEHRIILEYIDALSPMEKNFLLNILKQYVADKHHK